MKSVLMSIRPEWCRKIISGEKTIEVRNTRPKIDTPFKCYIYCSGKNAGRENQCWVVKSYKKDMGKTFLANGKVIGEFVCDEILNYEAEFVNDDCQNSIRKFEFDEEYNERDYSFETSNEVDNPDGCKLCKNSCLSFNEIKQYVSKGKEGFFDFYAWHISNLVIYDNPKELNDFAKADFPTFDEMYDDGSICQYCPATNFGQVFVNGVPDDFVCDGDCYDAYEEYAAQNRFLTRPPQSWCYVEGNVM